MSALGFFLQNIFHGAVFMAILLNLRLLYEYELHFVFFRQHRLRLNIKRLIRH